MVSKTVERFVMKLPLSTTQIDDGKRSVSIVIEAWRMAESEALARLDWPNVSSPVIWQAKVMKVTQVKIGTASNEGLNLRDKGIVGSHCRSACLLTKGW